MRFNGFIKNKKNWIFRIFFPEHNSEDKLVTDITCEPPPAAPMGHPVTPVHRGSCTGQILLNELYNWDILSCYVHIAGHCDSGQNESYFHSSLNSLHPLPASSAECLMCSPASGLRITPPFAFPRLVMEHLAVLHQILRRAFLLTFTPQTHSLF